MSTTGTAPGGPRATAPDPAALRAELVGQLLTPDDAAYDEARVLHNAMIDKRPALIAQCRTASDVAAALAHARATGLEVAVRGGGHGVAGTALSDGGMVIDLRRMNTVTVDAAARTVRVGGGATMSDLDRATEPHGLATTGGRVSTTGVGGFTLGGGTGWLDRKLGLACDNLVSVDLVTASGRFVTASETEHPELFWALHGGGGNFGVATALTLRLHELPVMSVSLLLWPADAGEEAVRAFRDLIDGAPDEISGGVLVVTGPPEEFVPEHLVGRPTYLVLVTCAGPEAMLREAIAPLVALAPGAELVMELPYADLQCMLDDPPGNRNYWSAEHLTAFPDEAVTAFVRQVDDMLVPSATQHVLFAAGGAVARSTADSPLPWRSAPWVVHPFAVWTDPADDERSRAWTKSVRAAMRPWATGDVYLNFIGEEGSDRVRAGFGPAWQRLVEVKREYDPDNVFRLNHNIDPAG